MHSPTVYRGFSLNLVAVGTAIAKRVKRSEALRCALLASTDPTRELFERELSDLGVNPR